LKIEIDYKFYYPICNYRSNTPLFIYYIKPKPNIPIMARFVKKLGTQQMRFQFDIELHSISLSVPYECSIQVVWKKDQKRLESKTKPTIGSGDVPGSASFADEKLSMISGLYKDPKKGTFSEKSS